MPLFFQQDIDADTKLGIWKIEEDEEFFLRKAELKTEINHPHKRLQHLAGRYLLSFLFPDFPVTLIEITDTRKPFLQNEDYHFSISHCGNYAAALVSRTKRVGVDIEIPSQKIEKIKSKFLHREELEDIDAVKLINEEVFSAKGISTQMYKLTLLWSSKEAVFKWWSYGAVDFSEMIRIDPFVMYNSGIIKAAFVSPDRTHPLTLQYRLFDGLCLVWTLD